MAYNYKQAPTLREALKSVPGFKSAFKRSGASQSHDWAAERANKRISKKLEAILPSLRAELNAALEDNAPTPTQLWSCDCGEEFYFTEAQANNGLFCRCETQVTWDEEAGS